MTFAALDEATLGNALSLNRAFLRLAASDDRPDAIPDALATTLNALTGLERGRLARAPFLIFSLGDYDLGFWRSDARPGSNDLFHSPMTPAERQLTTETLAVVWALTQVNRYAARYLCGAGVTWCDYAAATPLPELIAAATRQGSLLAPRFPETSDLWRKLLMSANDDRQFVRRAARVSALQCVLTTEQDYELPARAASAHRRSALGVAETRRSDSRQR